MKIKNILILSVIILTLVSITGCAEITNKELSDKTMQKLKSENINGNTITVIHDEQYNVTCWYIYGQKIGTVGFSCISDTQL